MMTAIATDPTHNADLSQFVGVNLGDGQSQLARYWQILRRWRWFIISSVGITIVVGAIATFSTTPIYKASTILEILREEGKVVNVEGVEPTIGALDQEFYQTQYGLLRSRELAERVVRKMGLARDDRFLALYDRAPTSGGLLGLGVPDGAEKLSVRRERAAIATVLENITITPTRASRLVTVTYASPDPSLSARLVDAWAENFIAGNLERRFDASAYARRFLEGRLRDLRGKLESSERDLVDYATQREIINVAGPIAADGRAPEQALVATNLAALNEALNEATAARVEAQSRIAGKSEGSSPDVVANEVIAGLRRQEAEASAELKKMSAQFKPDYPPLIALRSQIAEIGRLTSREERRVTQSGQQRYEAATKREALLQQRVTELKTGYLDNRRRSIQYNIFQREIDTNRTLYEGLLQRYKEIGIAGGVGTNNVSVVDRGVIPVKPSSPRPLVNLVIAALAGLFIGLVLAFILEQVDETISNPEQIEAKLGVPLLGAIPLLKDETIQEALKDTKSSISEAYFSVNTNLRFSTTHGIPKSLLITSSRPSEGKSTSAASIARTIARLGQHALLIDGDMRSPSLHRMFGLHNNFGLSDALSGNDNLAALLQPTDLPNLMVMTAGPQAPNPAELLSSDRMGELIGRLVEQFAHVVVDGPPVLGIADAPLLGSHVESVVYVAEAHSARLNVVRSALKRLLTARAHILGVILTKFEPKRSSLGYGEDYGYAYSYRYGSKGARTESAISEPPAPRD